VRSGQHDSRRLSVLYTGRYPRPIYRCEQPNLQLGQRRCLSVAGKRIDETIAAEMLRAVAPMAKSLRADMIFGKDRPAQASLTLRPAGSLSRPQATFVTRLQPMRLPA
jgi:hypothetical protein